MHVVVTNAAQDDFFGNRSRNLISCECVYNVDHGNDLPNSLPLPQSKVERLFLRIFWPFFNDVRESQKNAH